MIIVEGTPESPSKLAQDQLPSGASNQMPRDPPGYSTSYTSSSIPNIQYPYQPYPNPSYLLSPTLPLSGTRDRDESTKKRFLKALCAAIAIYVTFALVLRSLIIIMVDLTEDRLDTGFGFPRKSDGVVERCVRGGDNDWTPIAGLFGISFDLPLSADTLYLLARGSQVKGSLQMISDPTVAMDTMKVDIYVRHESLDVFRRTSVCVLERKPGEKGIGIFGPQRRIFSHPSFFMISVHLPSSTFPPLSISAFEANLPSFDIGFPALDHTVHFGSLTLHSTNSMINLISVSSEVADIKTTNNPISGVFRITSSLSLMTTNSPIKANISLENDPNSGKATSLNIKTTNGKLDSAIWLMTVSNSPHHSPRYFVKATTTNSPIGISFPQQHPYSHLDFTATTTNAAAWVRLNPGYEGTFDVSTSNADAQVHYDNRVADPAGKGRTRNIWRNSDMRHAAGWVEWETGGHVKVSVVVLTSNAHNDLILQ